MEGTGEEDEEVGGEYISMVGVVIVSHFGGFGLRKSVDEDGVGCGRLR